MKKLLLTVALVAVAGAAYAAPFTNKTVLGVQGTAHDLSTGAGGLTGGANQICIYCHTPHNSVVAVPLWNRHAPDAGITKLYNSPTLTQAAQGAAIGASSVSAMCMSCHDGITTYGNVQKSTLLDNQNFRFDPTNAGTDKMAATSPANLLNGLNNALNGDVAGLGGAQLTNDHPIGFNYKSAADQELAQYGAYNTGLYDLATANTKLGTNAFFGASPAAGFGEMMECASCHKVHDDRRAPFLRISNDKSQLCLACHIK